MIYLMGELKVNVILKETPEIMLFIGLQGVDYGVNMGTGTIELLVNVVEIVKNGTSMGSSETHTRRFVDCLYDRRI